jgi:hypothetical protein
MTRFRLLGLFGLFGVGVVAAMALGGLATFLRLTPGSDSLLPVVAVALLTVAVVGAGVVLGSGDGPDETAYW